MLGICRLNGWRWVIAGMMLLGPIRDASAATDDRPTRHIAHWISHLGLDFVANDHQPLPVGMMAVVEGLKRAENIHAADPTFAVEPYYRRLAKSQEIAAKRAQAEFDQADAAAAQGDAVKHLAPTSAATPVVSAPEAMFPDGG